MIRLYILIVLFEVNTVIQFNHQERKKDRTERNLQMQAGNEKIVFVPGAKKPE